MAIDKAELATEIDKNPEIVAAATEALTKKGFVIRDKVANDTFLENFKKDVIEKEIPKEISKVHSQYDQDVETALGVKKTDQSEKSYDYLKRAAKVKLDELNGKIEGYEKTIREKGDPSGVLQKKIEAAEEKARLAIAEKDNTIKELTARTELVTRQGMVNSAYSELSKSFRKDLPPLFARTAQIVIDDVLKSTILKDGVLYVSDGQGSIKKDASFNPIKVDDVLKTEFKDVIDTKREQPGAGSGKNPGGTSDVDLTKINKDNFMMPANIKTQGDLMDHLMASGFARGSVQFTEIWNKFALGYETVLDGTKKVQKTVGKPLPAR